MTHLSLAFLAFLVYSSAAVAQRQHAIVPPTNCVDKARLDGLPIDGWRIVVNADGAKTCRREVVNEFCLGEEYRDAITGEGGCCASPQVLTWIHKGSSLGFCCPEGHHWSGNMATAVGGCCPNGAEMVNGRCVRDCGESSCATSSYSCANNPACGRGSDLGIKFGHCYALSFPESVQFGAQREAVDYIKSVYLTDVPFKVCRATTDCSLGGHITTRDGFYLQDQFSRREDRLASKGWISNAYEGPHLSFTDATSMAGLFYGVPSTCSQGGYALKLRSGPCLGGLATSCTMEQPGFTFWERVSQTLVFSEVACDDFEIPLTSPINHRVYTYRY
ncbi:hypothetical protein BJ138DRAFT_150251 [Hygrophoropsis aurantiaca]|uniref:Uncharacterized protein n=1 Tax=Hygrophoropsis aurantiaca TaxID=72124 RepID=A0ACB8AP49_9AGAM|nr:hypothetical protein BJ138DRAFT_150251 [Hygrophoropsis aurantiaca]